MIKNDSQTPLCTCPSGNGSLRHPCPAHPAVEQAGGDERDFQAKGAQEVPSPVSKEYDRHLIGLLRKGEALPGHQEEAADEIERLRDWNDHLNNTVLPNILNPNFLMLMKGGERLLDLCTKDGKFIGVSLNDMKDVFDWMVTHARIAPDHAALAQPSPASDLDPLNLAPHAEAFNEAPDEALRPEQAEAERSALWAVHAQGPDELYAAFSREDAEKHAAELNALPMPEGIAVGAVVVPSPWPAVQHWQYLAEQEQDHKNEIAGRLRQHERIGEALRAEITQLRQHKNDYMDAGQETYRALQNEIREREAEIARLDGLVSGHTAERDAALARVAELERQEPVGWEWIEVFVGGNFDGEEADNGFYRGTDKENILPSIEGTEVRQRPLYAAPVAQTQHSVPVAREQLERLVRILDAHNYAKDAEALMALLAAAPGKEVPQAWLDVQAERRRQVEAEGWTPEHDDEHACDEIAAFACFYAMPPAARDRDTSSTGYGDTLGEAILPEGWEPKTGDRRRELVKAGGLILAEIERLDRTAATQGGPRDA
ncbi:hypothetical protein [Pseudomonas aeruginosa]|uniref:hypothetical protein n=1 Tax=Pseudomonas aeruginosa TaxID=287 RepID=UPI000B1720DF|nr:hypothetical protein [Pseudomonas aeruginosa]QBI82359.1 hypothetical protein [Pseudomonas phage vB_Pae_CF24a]QBI82488.1 hypothetical protein [Pseudomonas phage vB_Pae_CF69a]QBI82606.1 hypothetical protein [Pseudomonas phage vB_Pae_BR228a]QBI82678.1 hypothetical protein [Pseudomonas phage vB_Pae_BR197a]QBI82932.1 hypothetical protein [Pseudomonas phage vB_Pae_BR320a]QBI83059.1 hypothetical protein [Pseudomonas phage vB_Pae_BR150a]